MLQITINGTDISSNIISYTREKDLCSSEGITEFSLDSHLSIAPYSVIRAYEDSSLKGTFYTDFVEKMSDGTMTIHGRDNSKRAQDYYIAEEFTALGDTTSRYWIEFFLGLAGISYNFTTEDTGYIIQDQEVMGLTSCAEVVEMLVRYSGWYIFYNAENVAQIGKLQYDSTLYKETFTDTNIISIQYVRNDQYLRNRAVVWGAGYRGSDEWVFADISVTTPWDYDSLDKRTILARAGFPVPFSQAIATANVLLNEYSRLVQEKTVSIEGYYDLEIGDFVLIKSNYYTGIGLISAINASADASGGYTTTLVLDRRCPRFVGFYDVGGMIYAGTDGDGVWTKPLNGPHTWSDYSSGLGNTYVRDLDASYGVLSCTTSDGTLYTRTVGDSQWYAVNPGIHYTESGTVIEGGIYVASNINDIDQTVYGLWTHPVSGEYRTWLDSFIGINRIKSELISYSGNYYYLGIDVESNNEDIYISVDKGKDLIFRNGYYNEYVASDHQYMEYTVYSGAADWQRSDTDYVYSATTRVNINTLVREELLSLGGAFTPLVLLENEVMFGTGKSYDSGSETCYAIVDWKTKTLTLQDPLDHSHLALYYHDPTLIEIGNEQIVVYTLVIQVSADTNELHFKSHNYTTNETNTIIISYGDDNSFDSYQDTQLIPRSAVNDGYVYLPVTTYSRDYGLLRRLYFYKIDPKKNEIVTVDSYQLRLTEDTSVPYGNIASCVFSDADEAFYFNAGVYYNINGIFCYSFKTRTIQRLKISYNYGLGIGWCYFEMCLVNGKPIAIARGFPTDALFDIIDARTGDVLTTVNEGTRYKKLCKYGTGFQGVERIWFLEFDYSGNTLVGYSLGGAKTSYALDPTLGWGIGSSDQTNFVYRYCNQLNKFIFPSKLIDGVRYGEILKFSDATSGSGRKGSVLRKRGSDIESVFSVSREINLDISTPGVITAFTRRTTSGTIYLEGEPYTTGRSVGNLFFSATGNVGTFRSIHLATMSGSYINDSRSFTLISGEGYKSALGIVVLSGLFGNVGQFSYIDTTEIEEFGGTIIFPDIETIASFSSNPVAMETSNYNYFGVPTFLIGLDSETTPFLQRDADTEVFVSRSTNFPNSRITTIRLDEML